jgi:hypothetical protein
MRRTMIVFSMILLTAMMAQAQEYPSCTSVGGRGTTAADAISQTLSSPLGASRQVGTAGVYLSAGFPSFYAGFPFQPLGGLVYDGGSSSSGTTWLLNLRHQWEGVFLDDAALPTDCTPPLLSGVMAGTPCPKRLVVTDGCGIWSGEYSSRIVGLGSMTFFAPLPYHQAYNGSAAAPGIDAALTDIFSNVDINGGPPFGGIYHAGAYDSHIPNVSVYPWSGVLRPGTEVVIDDLSHGIMVGKVGAYVARMRVDFGSGGFQGDPNYQAFSPVFRGNLQSYITVEGMGYQITLGDMGSPVFSFNTQCPQVIGHLVALDSPDNIVWVQLDNGATFPGLIAASAAGGHPITKLSEAGNLTCQKDNSPGRDLDHNQLGANWLPNITTSAYLAGRYHLMDSFLNSYCDRPSGGTCGTLQWADVIRSVDSNIQSVGAKDNSDASGTQGDVYWTVQYYCAPNSDTCDGGFTALFQRILAAVMPGTTTSVYRAMVNWGLALPPMTWPPNYNWQIPSYYLPATDPPAILAMIIKAKGRSTAARLEAQQGNAIVIGGVMFNAQPNPPGSPGAPPDIAPVDSGYPAGDFTGSSSSIPAAGGDAPNGSPVF